MPSGELSESAPDIVMMNGNSVASSGSCSCDLVVAGERVRVRCLASEIVPGFDILLGMDAIQLLGGVRVAADGKTVRFGSHEVSAVAEPCVAGELEEKREGKKPGLMSRNPEEAEVELIDKDFVATFKDGSWHVTWKWADESGAPTLKNQVPRYRIEEEVETAFSDELDEWIKEGWLQEYDGPHDGIVPLLAVVNHNKNKVRPVLDYRELNQFVSSHTGQSVVCGDKIREWRRLGRALKLLDLRKAYLQVRVDPSLWKYQIVKHRGQTYCLTRLGFGLNVAPKIMTAIVTKVLAMDEEVREGTDSYIDDIIVNESVIPVGRVESLLRRYGLEPKDAVPLVDSRVLGLRIRSDGERILWERDNVLEPPHPRMTKRELFSTCGKLIGHFPVASWLRPACSYVKRLTNNDGWDSPVSERVGEIMQELWEKVLMSDPVRGVWEVNDTSKGRVWCDASSLAIGVCLELDGVAVEDASWLRPVGDAGHINLAELEAVVKGVNLALLWEVRDLEVMTDSSTVFGWIRDLTTDAKRIRSHGLGEVLVRRRLGLLREIMTECSVQLTPVLVRSDENLSDRLTRVPKSWLGKDICLAAITSRAEANAAIQQVHRAVHCGLDKTLYLMGVVHPDIRVTRKEVREVVSRCWECQSIDPNPVHWERGELQVEENWDRVSCDVTHVNGQKFLTLVDSGPSRFAIWRRIPNESAATVSANFERVFEEYGPPKELLLDNATTFRSHQLAELCREWSVNILFRAAYRPSGNGIVERHHRTIKRMAARTRLTIERAVFWYNYLPLQGTDAETSPHRRLLGRAWRCPLQLSISDHQAAEAGPDDFWPGETVLVKPRDSRCTSRWARGTVTAVTPQGAIEVDGIHRHTGDIRKIRRGEPDSDAESDDTADGDEVAANRGEPGRSTDCDL